jgi:hypothetical protein
VPKLPPPTPRELPSPLTPCCLPSPLPPLQLLLHECDGPQEHAVHLPPDEPVVAALLPVRSKFTRKAAKKAAGGAGGGEAALWEHLSDAQQGALAALAVYYVRLDPGSEWLGRLVLHQPEHMWGLQLRSKDVVEQSMAVEGGWLGLGGRCSCVVLLMLVALLVLMLMLLVPYCASD